MKTCRQRTDSCFQGDILGKGAQGGEWLGGEMKATVSRRKILKCTDENDPTDAKISDAAERRKLQV